MSIHVAWHAETRLVPHEKGRAPEEPVHTVGPRRDAVARARLERMRYFFISEAFFSLFLPPSLRC